MTYNYISIILAMLDESANKETASDRTSNKTEPVKALFRSPVCTSSWMNGEVKPF